MIRYESEKAVVEVYFADITDEERKKRQKEIEKALVRYYKEVVASGVEWPFEK